jgi:membrane-anchored glycerophosphoryl diester phosphodiesterase (GDPDase)
MPLPDSSPPRPEPARRAPAESVEQAGLQKEQLRARQKTSVYFAITLLLLCAIALVTLPLNKVPFAFRAVAAAGDVVIAAVLWLVVRQKLDGK